MISIINYGMGNLGSVVNMYKRIGFKTEVISTPAEIAKASKIILPGVGAFDAAMARIDELKLRETLNQKALVEKVPIMGICLGMQLLGDGSDEGKLPGLGWIPARAKAFKDKVDTKIYKVPHMGWSTATINQDSKIVQGFKELEDVRFYFVHSYYVECVHNENSVLKTTYGVEFDSAIHKDNIYGAQFHPEKSHKFGMKLLENFARI